MEPRQCVPLYFRGVRRLPLQRTAWDQRRRRHLHVLHRAVQLLPIRQLGLSAFVRFLEHPVVFHRRSCPDFSNRAPEDRAMVHKRLAIIRSIQQSPRHWFPDFVAAKWMAFRPRQSVHAGRGSPRQSRPRPIPQ